MVEAVREKVFIASENAAQGVGGRVGKRPEERARERGRRLLGGSGPRDESGDDERGDAEGERSGEPTVHDSLGAGVRVAHVAGMVAPGGRFRKRHVYGIRDSSRHRC